MDNILNVRLQDGNEVKIVVLDIIEGTYGGASKKYIVYSLFNQEDILTSILEESDKHFSLKGIDDEKEFHYLENLLLDSEENRDE